MWSKVNPTFVATFDHGIHFPTSTWHSLLQTNYTLIWLVDWMGPGRSPPRQPLVWSADCYHHGEMRVFVAAFDLDIHLPTSTWHSLIPTKNTLTCLVDWRGPGRCPLWQPLVWSAHCYHHGEILLLPSTSWMGRCFPREIVYEMVSH